MEFDQPVTTGAECRRRLQLQKPIKPRRSNHRHRCEHAREVRRSTTSPSAAYTSTALRPTPRPMNSSMYAIRQRAKSLTRIQHAQSEDVDWAIASARRAFSGSEWGGMDIRSQARLVNRLADAFEAHLDELYELETLNNGRPIAESRPRFAGCRTFSATMRGWPSHAGTP